MLSLHRLSTEIWVPAPIDEVWYFASDPRNLSDISPKMYGMTVVSDSTTTDGGLVQIRMAPFGLPFTMKWDAKISKVVDTGEHRKFIDIQDEGPFAYWKHEHYFDVGTKEIEGQRSGSKLKMHQPGTWIRDVVKYVLPLGFIGTTAHDLYFRHNLENLFWYRAREIKKIFSQKTLRPQSLK